MKTLEKAQAKEREKAQKEWRKLAGQAFNCQEDAEKAQEQFNQKWKYHRATAQAVAMMQYSNRGRPTAEDQKEVVGYKLEGSVEENATVIEEAKGEGVMQLFSFSLLNTILLKKHSSKCRSL